MVRDKSDIKQISDLKGKRVAWDYGGHAISQTFLNAVLETGGIKPSDVQQVRVDGPLGVGRSGGSRGQFRVRPVGPGEPDPVGAGAQPWPPLP